MSNGRLPPQPNEWIDRARAIRFRFEGESYTGFAGDTLSSALWASGLRLLGRSFKYHRPRGIYSLANCDVNVLLQTVDASDTNIRGDVTPLTDDGAFEAVNTFGGLRRDRAQVIDWFGRFLPVGFYYKTFHRPRRWFPFFEQRMREMAGLGEINPKLSRQRTPKAYDFCDVLVVGAGPAGLSAAIAAGKAGAKVVVVDENPRAGGSLNYQWAEHGRGATTVQSLLTEIAAITQVEIRTSTLAAALYADRWVALVDVRRLVKMRARSVVLATGAFEQPAVFGNNDLPGVMLATAAQRLVHQFAVKPFERGVVLAANDEAYRAALDLHRAGAAVAAIVDLRNSDHADTAREAREAGIAVYASHAVTRAIPGAGKRSIRGAVVAPLDAGGKLAVSRAFHIDADGLVMSTGWAPADGLFYQAGGRMTWSNALEQFIPGSAPEGLFAAGHLNGVFGLDEQLTDGRRAGQAAAAYLGLAAAPPTTEPSRPTASPSHPYPIFPDPSAKCFVDLDEDVQYKDFVHAAQEGFDQVELMKRYSTYGMGPTQGKIANTNAIRILAKIKGQTVPETGVTTSRPFFHPVPLKHLAGRGFHPHRHTPLHTRHERAGAVLMPAGEWTRPAYYAPGGEARDGAIASEVSAVRDRVGLIDVGTLGKIEISGPDAGLFIERLYTGRYVNMKVGTMRYGMVCDEAGVMIDESIVCRLSEDRFYLTTTTTSSTPSYREMQRWAIVWRSNVVLNNLTGSHGAVNLVGPRARQILATMCDVDLSNRAFPYLGVREGQVAGVTARLIRVGFVGEWGYEIHVPGYGAPRVWDALVHAGAAEGIRPFGVEAQRVLRLEKGHLIISQDTDGLTTPFEAAMDWAVEMDKPFFVGQRSLVMLRRRPLTRKLVGFTLSSGDRHVETQVKECHLIIDDGQIVGRVTSVAFSPSLKKTIGLAFVSPQRAAAGTPFQVRVDDGRMVPGAVAKTPFYDPENRRQTEAANE